MDLSDLYRAIEPIEIDNGWKSVPLNECGEELISVSQLSDSRIQFEAEYYKKAIPGSIRECYVRKGVAKMLLQAADALPEGCTFLIFDAWRPIKVQQYLFDNYVNDLKKEYLDMTENDIMELAQKYVSIPSTDLTKPSPHFTGGAVDLTIVDEKGLKIDMESGFDSFCEESHTRYYEERLENGEKLTLKEINFCLNRRLLYNIMISAGFTNFPNEWWHFDYGNQFWGYAKKEKAFYGLSSI